MVTFHRADGAADGVVDDDSVAAEVSREFLDRVPGGLFRYHAEGTGELDYVSAGLVEMFGCESYEEFCQLTGNTFEGMVLPDDWAFVDTTIREQISTGDTDRVVYRIRRADGEIRWFDDSGRLVEDEDGVRWFYVTVIDITDQVLARQALERANERLEIITALSNDVLFDIECGTGESHVYGDFVGRFGREPQQPDFVVHRRCQQECHLDIHSHDLSHLMQQIQENSLVDFETSTPGADGEPVWYRYQSVVLYNDDGSPLRHVGRLLDTHDMVMRESQFRKKAERDSLTGLYNRSAALDRIETMLNTESRPCTLITVDVDDFKAVNDTYGHPEGDRVLKELGAFLGQVMRKEDVVARMGGDEFAIFAAGLGPGPAIDRILEHLSRGPFATTRATDGSAPEQVSEEELRQASPTISIGAVCCLNPPIAFEKLYEAADETLYTAKDAGKAQYQLRVIE